MSQQRVFSFAGGLNLAGITMAMKPGECTLQENYECKPQGGYSRYEGYERYDGHPAPSDAVYARIPFIGGGPALAVNAVLTGSQSGATGQVISMTMRTGTLASFTGVGEAIIRPLAGALVGGEALMVSSATAAYVTADGVSQGSPTDADYDDSLALAADAARASILAVPGDGPILGVVYFQGKLYAFRNAIDNATACMYVESPTGWVLKKSGLAPYGRYEFRIANFAGGSGTRYLYGVSGVHKGFEWTGSTWNDVTTGMTVDKPTHLAVWSNVLVYSFPGGSVQNSGIGTPLTWTVRTGAAEIGMGDEITGFAELVGGNLAVYCQQKTGVLSGAPLDSSLALTTLSPDSGAFPYSIQNVPGRTLSVDARGIMPLSATQAYGDFETASVSQRVQPMIDARLTLIVDSMRVRQKSAYRIFFSDGIVLCTTFRGSAIVGFTILRFPDAPTCVFAGVDDQGNERLFMGGQTGFVYRLDVGMSFDGVAIAALLRTAPDAVNAPRQLKQFQNFILQMSSPRPQTFQVQALYDYELAESDITQALQTASTTSSNAWDLSNWDELIFDAGDERDGITEPSARIDGVGRTVALVIYNGDKVRPPYTLEAGVLIYKNRGFRR